MPRSATLAVLAFWWPLAALAVTDPTAEQRAALQERLTEVREHRAAQLATRAADPTSPDPWDTAAEPVRPSLAVTASPASRRDRLLTAAAPSRHPARRQATPQVPADGATATVHGTVTDAESGAPVADCRVHAYLFQVGYLDTAVTGADGTYSIPNLPAGAVVVVAEGDLDHVGETHDGATCIQGLCGFDDTEPLELTEGEDRLVDLALARAGRIEGRVTAAEASGSLAAGDPVASMYVDAVAPNGSWFAYTSTTADGSYVLGGLPADSYRLVAEGLTEDLQGSLYDGFVCSYSYFLCDWGAATLIPVTVGEATPGIDFALPAGGSISTTLRSSAQTPLAGVVDLIREDGVVLAQNGVDDSGVTRFAGLAPGTYYLLAEPDDPDLQAEAWQNHGCERDCDPTGGDPVIVSVGATAAVVFELSPRHRLRGQVKNTKGRGIANATVSIYTRLNHLVESVTADAAGRFESTPLAGSTFYLQAASSAHYDEVFGGTRCEGSCDFAALATPVVLTDSSDQGGLNFVLTPLPIVSGRVTDSVSHGPLAGVVISASTSSGTSVQATTGADGRYSLPLPAGTYYLAAGPGPDHVRQVWTAIDSIPRYLVWRGTPLVVGGANKGNVNFALATAGRITGTVTAAGGGPLAGLSVRVWRERQLDLAAITATDANGHYEVAQLPAGTYLVTALGQQGMLGEGFGGTHCLECRFDSDPVVVAAGQETNGVDLELDAQNVITGRVIDAVTNRPIAGARVYAADFAERSYLRRYSNVGTDSQGRYRVEGLPEGDWYVGVEPSPPYLNAIAPGVICNSCDHTEGRLIALNGVGKTVTGVNVKLREGITVSGRVEQGSPYSDIYLIDRGGSFRGATSAAADGSWSAAVPPGTYWVFVQGYGLNPGEHSIDEVYPDLPCPNLSCDVQAGTPIVVDADDLSDIDMTLEPGSQLIGRLLTHDNREIANTGIVVENLDGDGVGFVFLDAYGNFRTNGLPAGSYRLRTGGGLGGYLATLLPDIPCPRGICDRANGTVFTLAEGQEQDGITARLAPDVVIGGVVRRATGSRPLTGAWTVAYDDQARIVNAGAFRVSSSGRFRLLGMQAGSYRFRTALYPGYVPTFSDGTLCPGGDILNPDLTSAFCTPLLADPVTVSDTGLRDLELSTAVGVTFSGRVTDQTTGLPLSGVALEATNATGQAVGWPGTSVSGYFRTSAYPRTQAPRYLRVRPVLDYLEELWREHPCPEGVCDVTMGNPLPVPARGNKAGINFTLEPE
jgi:protocatechuate 3,4-dioxygenase beta subunit